MKIDIIISIQKNKSVVIETSNKVSSDLSENETVFLNKLKTQLDDFVENIKSSTDSETIHRTSPHSLLLNRLKE